MVDDLAYRLALIVWVGIFCCCKSKTSLPFETLASDKCESYAIVDHITMFQVSLDVESVVRDILRPHWPGVRSPAVSQSPPGDLPPKYEDLGQ